MKTPIHCFSLFWIFLLISEFQSQAQSGKFIIQMVKDSENNPRIVVIDDDSRFKLKLNNGQKIKGKVRDFNESFFVTVKGDTVAYNKIDWIKLQRELTNFQEIAALSAFLVGGYLSLGTVPAALFFIAMEGAYWIVLAPIASVSTAVIGLKLLSGRRYHLDKWKIQPLVLQL